MHGELGMKIDSVEFSKEIVKPYNGYKRDLADMKLSEENGFLHICGDNDWGYLLVDALFPLLEFAEEVVAQIREKISTYNGLPEVIILGKNEYRAVDILHRLKGCGEPIQMYKRIPVVEGKENDCIKLLGCAEELPFY